MTPTTEELARDLEDLAGGRMHRDLPDTLRAAAARLRELSAALKPFGSFGADNTTNDPGSVGFGVWEGNRCERERIVDWFGPTDFRRAAQLTETGQPPGDAG